MGCENSYHRATRLFPIERTSRCGRWFYRVPCEREETTGCFVRTYLFLNHMPWYLISQPFDRSREWTCPICDTTNLDLLPDPPAQDRSGMSSSDGQLHSLPVQLNGHTHTLSHQPMVNASLSSIIPQPDVRMSNTTSESQVIPSSTKEATEGTAPDRQVSTSTDAVSTTQTINLDSPSSASRTPLVQTTLLTPSPTPRVQNVVRSHQSSQKPPLLLDSAICVLVVVVFTIICRRIV